MRGFLGSFLAILLFSSIARLTSDVDEPCTADLVVVATNPRAAPSPTHQIPSIENALNWARWLRITPTELGSNFESFRYFLSRFNSETLRSHDENLRAARKNGMSQSRFKKLRRSHEVFRIPKGILLSMIDALTILRKHIDAPDSSFTSEALNKAVDRYIFSLRKAMGFNIHHLAKAGEIYAAAEMVHRGYSLVSIGQFLMDENRVVAEIDILLRDPTDPKKYFLGEVQVHEPGWRAWGGQQMKVRQRLLDGDERASLVKGGLPIEVSKVFVFVMRPSQSYLDALATKHGSGFELTTFLQSSQFARGLVLTQRK